MRSVQRFIYSLMLYLLLPYIFLRLLWRARKQPEYLQHIGERFGFYKQRSSKPVIWLHAVSVGETRATASLVGRLHAEYPDHQILLTHTTPTGRATSTQLYGDSVLRVYLPYDYPFAVQNFIRHFRPVLGVLMETEIWFNLIHACHLAQIPVLLLNARMAEKSARGYARFPSLIRTALQQLSAIAAQTESDAARLHGLGGKNLAVMGNLKFDIAPPQAMLNLGMMLRQQFGSTRKVFLAASTRDGEEALLLDAWQARAQADNILLVMVPRHPQRFDEVGALLTQRHMHWQRRSENKPVATEVQVILGDSLGEMFAYYAAADLAFIGGSLLPYGGQNFIEACAIGTPVLMGQHTYNFAEAARLATAIGAVLPVTDSSELIERVQKMLRDNMMLLELRDKGLQFVAAHQGATGKAMELIKQTLS